MVCDVQQRLEWVLRRLPPRALHRTSADLRWGGADRTAGAYVAAKTLDKMELAEQLGQRAGGEEDHREAAAFGAWARGLPAMAAPLLRVCLLHGSPPLPEGFAEGRGTAALEAWRATLQPAAAALPVWCRHHHGLWPPNFRAAVRALLLANLRGLPGQGSVLHLDQHMIDGIVAAAAADVAAWAGAWSLLREHD